MEGLLAFFGQHPSQILISQLNLEEQQVITFSKLWLEYFNSTLDSWN